MTSSRSNGSINKRVLVVALLLFGLGTAHAEKRKRVVVLPFEGDEKAEKFHSAVIKLVKKSHTVVSADKWEGAAEEMSATKLTDKNIKKVAKKLKVDGIIEGKVEKRRDAYMVKLKLRSGASGVVVGSVDTKAEGPRLDGTASKDVKDELIEAIGNLDSVRGGGGEDEEEEEKPAKKKKGEDAEEEKPAKKKKGGDAEEEEEKPAKSKFGSGKMSKGEDAEEEKPAKKKKGEDAEEEKPAKKKKGEDVAEEKPAKKKKGEDVAEEKPAKKKGGEEEEVAVKSKKGGEDEEEAPLPKKKKSKEVAAKEGEEIEEKAEPREKMDAALAVSPGKRAVDVAVGLSFNARRMSFKADADLAAGAGAGQGRPPSYKGVPAPGAYFDITAYPLAFGHKNEGITKDIGVEIMVDQALLISSKDGDGNKLQTKAGRFAFGGVFRYPLGKGASAPVVGGKLLYGQQKFLIADADIPSVTYGMIEPGVFFKYPLNDKITLNTSVSYMLITKSGDITSSANYGKSTVSGIEAELGGDYSLTKAIFARAALKLETIGYKFKGDGMLTTGRDSDPEQDVAGARDTYIGASFSIGYLY
jgi:hypothetical protein